MDGGGEARCRRGAFRAQGERRGRLRSVRRPILRKLGLTGTAGRDWPSPESDCRRSTAAPASCPHKELRAAIDAREAARAERERELDPRGYEGRARRRRWRKFSRHPVRNLLNPL